MAAIYWGVYDHPTDPDIEDTTTMIMGVGGGPADLLASMAELLPKNQTQLAGILRLWATLAALGVIAAMALQFIQLGWLY